MPLSDLLKKRAKIIDLSESRFSKSIKNTSESYADLAIKLLSRYHIASYIKRNGIVHDYGTTSAVKSYSYFFEQLKDWMIEKLNTQEDCGPLEELTQFLKVAAKDAKGILIAAGATAYTDFGKKNFLKKDDEIFVYVYNAHAHSFQDIMNDMCGMDTYLGQCSKLHQIVRDRSEFCVN